jgi:hypothetical protein
MYSFLLLTFAILHCPQVVRYVLEPAAREIYFVGPRLKGYGFWNGLPHADICAQITQTSVDVWRGVAAPQCSTLVQQYFEAFYVGTYFLLYAVTLYITFTTWQQVYFFQHQLRFVQTTMKEIKNN